MRFHLKDQSEKKMWTGGVLFDLTYDLSMINKSVKYKVYRNTQISCQKLYYNKVTARIYHYYLVRRFKVVYNALKYVDT